MKKTKKQISKAMSELASYKWAKISKQDRTAHASKMGKASMKNRKRDAKGRVLPRESYPQV